MTGGTLAVHSRFKFPPAWCDSAGHPNNYMCFFDRARLRICNDRAPRRYYQIPILTIIVFCSVGIDDVSRASLEPSNIVGVLKIAAHLDFTDEDLEIFDIAYDSIVARDRHDDKVARGSCRNKQGTHGGVEPPKNFSDFAERRHYLNLATDPEL